MVAAAAAALAQSATVAGRSVTSRAIAPTAMQAVEGMVEIQAMVVEEDLAEVRRKPGGYLSIAAITAFSEVPALCPLLQLQLRWCRSSVS